MDGLDAMMKDRDRDEGRGRGSTGAPASASRISPSDNKNESPPPQEYTRETEEHIAKVIESYKSILTDLADSRINDQVNQILSRIKYSKFVQYYLENASLSHYSIETELNRMDFMVTHNGTTTTCKETIQDIFWETKLHDVWRFANQSVYADALKHLQCYFEGFDLNISTVASTSQFQLNLDEHLFSATGVFDIVLESHCRESHRLSIASVTANIEVSLTKKTLRQWFEQPLIKMVFDADLRDAAITQLASEDSNLETSSELAPSRKIDTLVDAVSDTAQALPEHIHSIMSDFSLEGAVGFFGKLIGAADRREETSNAFGDLSNALRENKQLPVSSTLSTQNISASSKKEDNEEWDDWD